MQQDLNTHIFEELMHYVKDAHSSFSLDNEFHSTRAVPEVPTAALITGLDMSLFFSFRKIVKNKINALFLNDFKCEIFYFSRCEYA